jgi:hypothetical protein
MAEILLNFGIKQQSIIQSIMFETMLLTCSAMVTSHLPTVSSLHLSGLFSQNISCSHDIAKQLLKVTKNTYNNCDFTHMSDSDKLKLLLNTCVKPVARFIIQIFNIRTQTLSRRK